MSVQAISWAFAMTGIPATAKFVLVALANYADKDGAAFPGQQRLATDTGLSVRAVQNNLKGLEEAGLITREERFREDGSRAADHYLLAMTQANAVQGVRDGGDNNADQSVVSKNEKPTTSGNRHRTGANDGGTTPPARDSAPPARGAPPPERAALPPRTSCTTPPESGAGHEPSVRTVKEPGRARAGARGHPPNRSTIDRGPFAAGVPPDERQWALGEGLSEIEIARAARRFCDHHKAQGSTMADWQAAWRSWVRGDLERLGRAPSRSLSRRPEWLAISTHFASWGEWRQFLIRNHRRDVVEEVESCGWARARADFPPSSPMFEARHDLERDVDYGAIYPIDRDEARRLIDEAKALARRGSRKNEEKNHAAA